MHSHDTLDQRIFPVFYSSHTHLASEAWCLSHQQQPHGAEAYANHPNDQETEKKSMEVESQEDKTLVLLTCLTNF